MSGILATISNAARATQLKAQQIVDAVVPPEKRSQAYERLQIFAAENPKLSAYLFVNIVCTGLPLLMFVSFAIAVFLSSFVAALLVALLAAILFTLLMVGMALLVVLPTVFMTTFAASFIYLWGLGAYFIFAWFSGSGSAGTKGSTVSNSVHSWTGGRFGSPADEVHKKELGANPASEGTNMTDGRSAGDSKKGVNGSHSVGIGSVD